MGILLFSGASVAVKAGGHGKQKLLRETEEEVGPLTRSGSREAKDCKVKSEDGCHGEGAGVGIPASKGERDLEYITEGTNQGLGPCRW